MAPSRSRRAWRLGLLLAGLCACVAALSLWLGTIEVTPLQTLRILLGLEGDALQRHAILSLRLPRVAVALGAGAALALSGAILQGVLRNPIVEPGVLGLNAGAALAAAVVLVLGTGSVPPAHLSLAAILGALAALALVVRLAWTPGRPRTVRLILSGIAVGALGEAALTAVSLVGPPQRLQRLRVWMSGDLGGASLQDATLLWAALAVLIPLGLASARALDLRGLDALSSAALGNRRARGSHALLAMAAALAGVATALCGIIVFVGLIAPHLARRLVGPQHAGLLPVSALIGALVVASADLVGRALVPMGQLPAGLIAALVGAPYFFYLMRRSHG